MYLLCTLCVSLCVHEHIIYTHGTLILPLKVHSNTLSGIDRKTGGIGVMLFGAVYLFSNAGAESTVELSLIDVIKQFNGDGQGCLVMGSSGYLIRK